MSSSLTLVTGATGFVGSAVARALLAEGHELRLLARPGSDWRNIAGLGAEIVEGDLNDHASLARACAGCRYVMHVAADYRLWVRDPDAMLRTNVAGTSALMSAALAAGVERIVYTSSVAALGLTDTAAPADEETLVRPEHLIGAYKRSKYLAQQAVETMAAEGLPVVIVNPTTPVGPRDLKPTPTGKLVLDAAASRMPAYVDTGLNLAHVDDVARGHVLALHKGRIGRRYILGGTNMMLGDILTLVADVAGRSPPRLRLPTAPLWPLAVACEAWAHLTGATPLVSRDTLAMARKTMFFSSARAEAELGYTARPVRAAIEDAVAWFRAAGMLR